FLGYQVISRVSPLLHTPLMSATNAISGISLVGSLVVAGAEYSRLSTILGFIAVTASTINVVGGFLITDRILKMFRARRRWNATQPAPALLSPLRDPVHPRTARPQPPAHRPPLNVPGRAGHAPSHLLH